MGLLLRTFLGSTARRRPWQSLLAILGIALGVAVANAIDLSAAAALQSFRGAVAAVAGNTTHEITGAAGRVPDELLAPLLMSPHVVAATPVLSTAARAPEYEGAALRLLGVDPFSDFRFRAYSPTNTSASSLNAPEAVPNAFQRFMTEANTLVLARPIAQQHGLQPGDTLLLQAGTGPRTWTILALFDPMGPGAESAGELALCDIAAAQDALGLSAGLDRIDLILPGDFATQDLHAEALRAKLPPGLRLERPAARSSQVEQLIAAFRLNLQALSLLALFVGLFLIYNTMRFAVVQRRGMIGIVRALGGTQRAVQGAFLTEALLLGLGGAVAGIALGTLLAQGAVKLVAQTITDLYAYVRVTEAPLTAEAALKGGLLGLAAALIAAWIPAREAAQTPPRLTLVRSVYEQQVHTRLVPLALLGLGIFAVTWLVIRWEAGGTAGGFAAAFLLALGCACFTPHTALGLTTLLRPVLTRFTGPLSVLGIANVSAALSRTGLAMAALMVALAMTIGVTTMIRSFRQTVQQWVGGTIIADVYIRPEAQEAAGTDAVLDAALIHELGALPGVTAVSTYRARELEVEGRPVIMAAIDVALLSRESDFDFLDTDAQRAWAAAASGEAVLISEPFARRFGKKLGDTVALPTPDGPWIAPIAGTYRDYTADRGVIMIDAAHYRRRYRDPRINSIALFADPAISAADLAQTVRDQFGGPYGLYVASNRELRAEITRIFDRTFRVTGVMQGLAAAVAFVGVLSALLSLLLERTKEFGTLRALGATWGAVSRMLLAETAFMGLVASLLAILCGSGLSWILVTVINLRSFGWTIPLTLEAGTFVQAMVLAIGAAALAGLGPALRLRDLITAAALREE